MCGDEKLAAGAYTGFVTVENGQKANGCGQNGYDCGMYSLKILEWLTVPHKQETLLSETDPVSFEGCLHEERIEVLHWTAGWIHSAMGLYEEGLNVNGAAPVNLGNLPELTLGHIRDKTFHGIAQFQEVKTNLVQARLDCPVCADEIEKMREGLEVDDRLVVGRPENRNGGRGDEGGKGGSEDSNEEEEEENRELGDLSDGEGEWEPDFRRELLELGQRADEEVVQGRKEPVRKLRLVQPYQLSESMPQGVVKRFDPLFDSYHTGPTAERLLGSYVQVYAAFQSSPATARWNTVGDRFCDHGYRRTAGGFHQFYLNEPVAEDQLAHFFPLPPKDVLDEWKRRRGLSRVGVKEMIDGTWDGPLPVEMIEGNDLEMWTLERMVGVEAGEEGTDEWMKTYITGKTGGGSYIHLDIHKSRKQVENLQLSADIDAVIWVTDNLKVRASINLQLLPFKGEKAPIRKHNHTYVQLYWPRTEVDKKQKNISNASMAVPISNLPNTHFAHFGKAEGSVEVFVVFPRMKHKYPLRKMWETKVPYEVETFWLEKVVYRALKGLDTKGVKPYVDWNFQDMLYKNRGLKEKSLYMSPEHLNEIVVMIRAIVKENESDESFSRFGSFFFVLQTVGIKISMSMDHSWEGLWEKLVTQQPGLDWEHMEDTENGELLVDLGIGIHPPAGEKVVGFWDVEALRQGFDYGGYKKGTTHGASTVSGIGGIHAEMSKARRKQTHVSYRLAYNLAYEILRGNKTRLKRGFFPVQSAYEQDQSYRESVKGVVDACERSMEKSFGVRDEYRCRASSIKRVLPLLKDKVSSYRLSGLCGFRLA